MKLRLNVWKDGRVADVPLEVPGAVDLRALPGASGIHVVLSDEGGIRLRAEMPADREEVVSLLFELDEHGAPHVRSSGRHVVLLPADVRYAAPEPIARLATDAPLDLAIVVDGTTRTWLPGQKDDASQLWSGRLLERREPWSAHVDTLLAFAQRLSEGSQTRVAVLAFGDQELPAQTTRDLQPRYLLHPPEEERTFQPLAGESLRQRLLSLPPTPGGDFVDALADALAACGQLRWRPDARKMIVLTGDSPGSSLLYELPLGSDLCVRRFDVDTQAMQLHQQGVELITIYHPPPDKTFTIDQLRFVEATRRQYARLASLPELAFEVQSFDPEAAAERARQIVKTVGRGATLAEIMRGGEL